MKKNYIKIVLDLFMLLFIVLFYNKHTINMTFHEIGGLLICLVFLIHIGINSRWVCCVSKKMFDKNLSVKCKIKYVVDFLLLVTFSSIVISGIMFSRLFFTSISGNHLFWKNIHYFSAGISVILLGIHIGLNLPFIKCVTKKIVSVPQKISITLLTIFVALILALGSYSMANSNFSGLVSTPFTQTQNNHYGKNQGGRKHLENYNNNNYNNRNNFKNKNNNHQININNIFLQGATYGSIILTISLITIGAEKLIKRKI